MKKIIAIVGLSLVILSCSNDKYQKVMDSLKSKNYDEAQQLFSQVDKSDPNYADAKKKYLEIDKIFEVMEKEQAVKDSLESIEREKSDLENLKLEIKNELDIISNFNGGIYRGSLQAVLN